MDILSIIFSPWAVGIVLVLGGIIYRSIQSQYNHFRDRRIVFRKPTFLLGNMGDVLFRKTSFYELILSSYRMAEGKSIFGIFSMTLPILFVNDPELIRQITVKEFDSFVDRYGGFKHAAIEPFLVNSLLQLRGEKWRDMRSTLSPAFTGSKMRYLFQLIDECTRRTIGVLRDDVHQAGKPYELKELFSRFANDVIATAAFGIEVNSVKDPLNAFYTMGTKTLDFSSMPFFLRSVYVTIAHAIPIPLPSCVKSRLFTADKVHFYHSLVHDTMKYRQANGTVRPDMIQLLMEARTGLNTKRIWHDDDITAQCFLFFLAGFETISNALSLLGHELVVEPDVQTKLVTELDHYRQQMSGRPLAYDDLTQLKYLDMVISELLRKWPTLLLDRVCTKDCQLTDSRGNAIHIKKDDIVWMPVMGIHRDAQFYEDPDHFDPERFGDERRHTIQPFAYLPFGSGPRNCIGSRFALMELKVFVFHFLGAFTFGRDESTQIPLRFGKTGFSFKSERGINVRLLPRASLSNQ